MNVNSPTGKLRLYSQISPSSYMDFSRLITLLSNVKKFGLCLFFLIPSLFRTHILLLGKKNIEIRLMKVEVGESTDIQRGVSNATMEVARIVKPPLAT